jgi:hypothetical protein
MKIFGSEHSKREVFYLFLILVLLLSFLLNNLAYQETIKSYRSSYNSCISEINRLINYGGDSMNVWGDNTLNVSELGFG